MTASSERIIPVHSELERIGFREHVERVKRAGSERLWPNLKQSAKGKWSPNFSKWFTRERKAVGVYDVKIDFHSFRHSVVDTLANARVPDERIKAIVGHSAGKNLTQGTYRKRFRVEVVQPDIEKLSYDGLDLGHLCP